MKAKKDLIKKQLYIYDEHDTIYAFKMMGNNHRMTILNILFHNPGLTVDQITGLLGIEFKNVSFHTRKLYQAKLLVKKTNGSHIQHYLNEYGKQAVRTFNLFGEIEHE